MAGRQRLTATGFEPGGTQYLVLLNPTSTVKCQPASSHWPCLPSTLLAPVLPGFLHFQVHLWGPPICRSRRERHTQTARQPASSVLNSVRTKELFAPGLVEQLALFTPRWEEERQDEQQRDATDSAARRNRPRWLPAEPLPPSKSHVDNRHQQAQGEPDNAQEPAPRAMIASALRPSSASRPHCAPRTSCATSDRRLRHSTTCSLTCASTGGGPQTLPRPPPINLRRRRCRATSSRPSTTTRRLLSTPSSRRPPLPPCRRPCLR